MTSDLSRSPAHHPADRLDGRTPFVTGLASGVGLEITRVFHAEGAHVIATDIDRTRLEHELKDSDCLTVRVLDVADEHDCVQVVAQALQQVGGAVDPLVNNAGPTIRGDIQATTSELFTRTCELKLGSAMRLCRLIALDMCTQFTDRSSPWRRSTSIGDVRIRQASKQRSSTVRTDNEQTEVAI